MAKVIKRDLLTHKDEINIRISESIAGFILSRQSICTKATIKYYQYLLPRILAWFETHGIFMWGEVTAEVIRDYLEELRDTGHSQGGVHSHFRTLRALMNWVWNEYDIEIRNPISKVKCQDRRPEPIPGITIAEVGQMIDQCKYNKFPERDRALIAVLVDTGIRRTELMTLTMADIDLDRNMLTIKHGKGNKFRQVFVGKECKKLLRKYLSRLEDIRPSDPLWLTNEGDPLTICGARSILRRTQRAAGLERIHDFHDFRRCFAIERKRNGDDDITISRALGHSSLEVTKRYLAFTEDDDRSFALRASPMDNRKRK